MQTLALRHACQLNDALAALYAQPDPTTLFDRLAAALLDLFGAETICFDRFDTQGSLQFLGAWPQHVFTPQVLAVAAPFMPQHPLYEELFVRQNSLPLRTSDFGTVHQFAGTDLYQHLYRPFALTHHLILAALVPGGDIVTCCIFRNHRDFTESERILLAFVRPHIGTLLRLTEQFTPSRVASGIHSLVPGRAGLTPREADILFHLAQGRTDKEIAQLCRISPRTVQNHLRNIYAKLGVDNRTAASRRAVAW
ncbi:helix-turn-helix transcriptional regulator [Hymenobacter terrenus]|uniref:helix-turn-helix transcriptional regulator n=1 Tax=Hymenobacter terrenus TaxID=1629124 RepID=UPI000695F020|nr:LuxR C-terminal-related transcriptional regulator [Hymenobacter terrenus]